MSNIPNLVNDDDDDKLIIELNDSQKLKISIQAYQAVHNHITGKSDKIIQYYEQPFQIEINDIAQLHKKISQILSTHDVIAKVHTLTVSHIGDSKVELSSIEQYDVNIIKPIEFIELKYNVSILPKNVPDKIKKPENYTITVSFVSGIAVISEMKKIRKTLPNGYTAIPGYYTAKIKIEYVNYLIAQPIKTIIDEHILGFKTENLIKPLSLAIKYSNIVKLCIKYSIFITFLILSMLLVPHYLLANNLISLARFSLWTFTALFFSYKLGKYFGIKMRVSLTDLEKLSVININKGDANLIRDMRKLEKNSIIKVIGSFISNIIISIGSAIIAGFILK